jgi:hypothetical protein
MAYSCQCSPRPGGQLVQPEVALAAVRLDADDPHVAGYAVPGVVDAVDTG